MPSASFDQDSFRGRDDDVAINSTTFNGGGGLNTNWSQDAGVNFRVRFLIQETAGNMAPNKNFDLYFDVDGGGYNVISATSLLQYADTTQYTNGATTSQVIGAGTYVSGESLGGVDNAAITGNVDFGGSDEAEVEFALQIDTAQVSGSEVITLEVRDSGSSLGAYTRRPAITVVAPQEESVVTLGSYTFTGRDPTSTVQHKTVVTAGSYTFSGKDPSSAKGFSDTVDAGSYTFSGQDVSETITYADAVDAGSYTFSGQDVGSAKGVADTVDAGSYTFTGFDPTSTVQHVTAVDAGSYTQTGQDPTSTVGRATIVTAGSYTFTGLDPTSTYTPAAGNETSTVDLGAYTFTGYDITSELELLPEPITVIGHNGRSKRMNRRKLHIAHSDRDEVSRTLRKEDVFVPQKSGVSQTTVKLHQKHVKHSGKNVPLDKYAQKFKEHRAEYMRKYRKEQGKNGRK